MKNKKLKNIYSTIFLTGISFMILQCGTIILWILTGIRKYYWHDRPQAPKNLPAHAAGIINSV
jgi:hypothetical protein